MHKWVEFWDKKAYNRMKLIRGEERVGMSGRVYLFVKFDGGIEIKIYQDSDSIKDVSIVDLLAGVDKNSRNI